MSNVILRLQSIYNEPFFLNADSVESFNIEAHYTSINTKSGLNIKVMNSVEDIIAALSESFFMIKQVEGKFE